MARSPPLLRQRDFLSSIPKRLQQSRKISREPALSVLCGEQRRGVCAVYKYSTQSHRDLGNGAALVGAQAEGHQAGVEDARRHDRERAATLPAHFPDGHWWRPRRHGHAWTRRAVRSTGGILIAVCGAMVYGRKLAQ